MQNLIKPLLSFVLFFALSLPLDAQVFLRLDEAGTTDAIRFFQGDKMELKTKYYPNDWVKRRIVEFMPETKTIVFDEDFYTVDEIIAVRRVNTFPKYLGNAMWQFGVVWVVYGLILDVTGTDNISLSNLSIGIGSAVAGFTLKKFAAKKTYNLGSKYTLRMIDTRMSVDP